MCGNGLTIYHAIPTFNDPERESFENIVGKGENAGKQHFLLIPTMFSTLPKTSLKFLFKFILPSANAINLDQSKNFVILVNPID